MASKYNSHIITIENNKVSLMLYGKAYMISQMRCGVLKGREWKASIFFVIWLGSMLYMSIHRFNMSSNPVPLGVSMICLYMITYYLFIFPKRVKLNGEHLYKSSHMLNKTETIIINRDNFFIKNEYEKIMGYWTDITDCIETREYFLIISEYTKRLIIISKKCINQEELEKLSEFLKQSLTIRYRKIKK